MIKWLKKIFKRKENDIKVLISKPKIDLSNIKFELNIKSICYFEKLTGTSFYYFTEDYLLELLYSIFHVNNPQFQISLEAFNLLLEREDIATYFINAFYNFSKTINQLQDSKKTDEQNVDTPTNEKRITDYVNTLIIEYGMDANYVMYKMEVWELYDLFEAVDTKVKRDLINKRFWTYIQIMPHIDTKKIKTPEALIPYEWEQAEIKARKEQDLKNNMFAIKNMIGKNIFGEEDDE